MSTFDGEETQSSAPLAPEIAVNIYNDVMMMSYAQHSQCYIEMHRCTHKQRMTDATIQLSTCVCVYTAFTHMFILVFL